MNLFLIILFILIDLLKIAHLWDENILRRTLHHLQRGQYNINKKLWIKFPKVRLSNNEINQILKISSISKKKCLNNLSNLGSKIAGGQYSKKCSLYYNDFDESSKNILIW